MKLSEKLRALREKKAITLEKVAESLGVTRSAVNQWELNIGNPTIDNLKAIAHYYGVTVDFLLDSKEEEAA